jgi:hypothetical protein
MVQECDPNGLFEVLQHMDYPDISISPRDTIAFPISQRLLQQICWQAGSNWL